MKIITIYLIYTILNLNLFARVNPFEPTDTFNQMQAQYNLTQEQQELMHQEIEDKQIEEKQIEEKKVIVEKSTKYNILKFINASSTNNSLIININSKYKLINQDIIYKKNKFVFDFGGTINMYTKKKRLKHSAFKSIVVGSHMKKKFFRVVVSLTDKISKYEESIDIDNSIITIRKIK
jgi:hypothetical protein